MTRSIQSSLNRSHLVGWWGRPWPPKIAPFGPVAGVILENAATCPKQQKIWNLNYCPLRPCTW
jgi:hypothetical protein